MRLRTWLRGLSISIAATPFVLAVVALIITSGGLIVVAPSAVWPAILAVVAIFAVPLSLATVIWVMADRS